MTTLERNEIVTTIHSPGYIMVQKEAHQGWFWAAGHSIITGLGPGTLFAPLLVKLHGIHGAILVAFLAALITLAGQCLLSRLFGRFGGIHLEDIFDAAAAEPTYADVKMEPSHSKRKLLVGLGKVVDIILLLTVSAVSLTYLMVVAGQAASVRSSERVEQARIICLVVMLVATLSFLKIVKRIWIDKIRPWTPYLTFFFCTLPTFVLILLALGSSTGGAEKTGMQQLILECTSFKRSLFSSRSLASGVGLAMFMLANYPHVGHIRSRCPQNNLSIFMVPMAVVVFPCFLIFSIGGWIIFDPASVPFGIDILTSASHTWPSYITMRYIFAVDRLVAFIFLVDLAVGLLQKVFLCPKNRSETKLHVLRVAVSLVVGMMALICCHYLVPIITWSGLVLIGPLFLVIPAGISLFLRGEKSRHKISSVCIIAAILILMIGALLHGLVLY